MLTIVKLALRISGTSFDDEINLLIRDCLAELKMLGIDAFEGDAQIQSAVIAYCKWKFGSNDESAKWEKIYNDKVTKLKVSSQYRKDGDSGWTDLQT